MPSPAPVTSTLRPAQRSAGGWYTPLCARGVEFRTSALRFDRVQQVVHVDVWMPSSALRVNGLYAMPMISSVVEPGVADRARAVRPV